MGGWRWDRGLMFHLLTKVIWQLLFLDYTPEYKKKQVRTIVIWQQNLWKMHLSNTHWTASTALGNNPCSNKPLSFLGKGRGGAWHFLCLVISLLQHPEIKTCMQRDFVFSVNFILICKKYLVLLSGEETQPSPSGTISPSVCFVVICKSLKKELGCIAAEIL